jgi:hypothetical protein
LPPAAGHEDDSDFPLQKRTPSDPTGSRKGTIAVQPKTPSDPLRSRISGNVEDFGRSRSGSELVGKTYDEMQDMANQTKQGTVTLLQEMITELEEKIDGLKTQMEGEADEAEKEKLGGEIKTMEAKLNGMQMAMQAQAQGQMGVMNKPHIGRMRSASEVGTPVVRQRSQSGFSFSSGGKEIREPQSPSVTKKGLFGTVRKQRHKSASGDHLK